MITPHAIQYVETPNLKIAYEQHGPTTGEAVILLHGFPYSPAPTTTSPQPSQLKASASSSRTCAATARLASTAPTPCAPASKPPSPRTCWIC